MPNRLYSDLIDGTGRRYYCGLNSAPGGITNSSPAMLTLFGRTAVVQELTTAFRTPATALLTLNGLASGAGLVLQPAVGALSMGGLVPTEQRSTTITNALPPDYSAPVDNLPTAITIMTVSPAQATLTLSYPAVNLTQGGNIVTINAGLATLTLSGLQPNLPRQGALGALIIAGLVPTLKTEAVISPDCAALTIAGLDVEISIPFVWIDDAPVAPSTWIDDPAA